MLDELGESLESGLGPGGSLRSTAAVVVVAFDAVLATEDADDWGRGLCMLRLRTVARREVRSLSLSAAGFASEGRRPVFVGAPLGVVDSRENRSSTGTSISGRSRKLSDVPFGEPR
jgi:hypothetical protein